MGLSNNFGRRIVGIAGPWQVGRLLALDIVLCNKE